MPTPLLNQTLMQLIAQPKQMARVLRGIVQHVRGERAHAPIGALMFFVKLHAEELLQQRRQTERANPQQLSSYAGVEEIPHLPAVVLMQQSQIVVGVV